MRWLKFGLKTAFMLLNLCFFFWVIIGEYRKLTVFLYLSYQNFYFGGFDLIRLAMLGEVVFLFLFSLYVLFFIKKFFHKKLEKWDYFNHMYWGAFIVYLIFLLMIHELYS